MDPFVDEVSGAVAPVITRLIEIADKYGQDRNEVVQKAVITLVQSVFACDFSDYEKGDRHGQTSID